MIKIIVDRLPSNPSNCPFYNTYNHKCLIKKHLGFSNKKCEYFCSSSWNNSCPYLMSFDDAANWREKTGKVQDEFARLIYQVEHGKLPSLGNESDSIPVATPIEKSIEKINNPHTFIKRRFRR